MARALTHLSWIWPQFPRKSSQLQRTASTASFLSCSTRSSGRRWAMAPRVSAMGLCWWQRKGSSLQGSRDLGHTPTSHSSMPLQSGSSSLYSVHQMFMTFFFAHDNCWAVGKPLLTHAWIGDGWRGASVKCQTWPNFTSAGFLLTHCRAGLICSVCPDMAKVDPPLVT